MTIEKLNSILFFLLSVLIITVYFPWDQGIALSDDKPWLSCEGTVCDFGGCYTSFLLTDF
jgi:hypothetical protein